MSVTTTPAAPRALAVKRHMTPTGPAPQTKTLGPHSIETNWLKKPLKVKKYPNFAVKQYSARAQDETQEMERK